MLKVDSLGHGKKTLSHDSFSHHDNRVENPHAGFVDTRVPPRNHDDLSTISAAYEHDNAAEGVTHPPVHQTQVRESTPHADVINNVGRPGTANRKSKVKATKGKKGTAKEPSAPGATRTCRPLSFIEDRVAVILYLAVSGLHCLFLMIATALSQLDEVGGGCFTFWGYKSNCDTVHYTIRTQLFQCIHMKTRLQTGAAFSIFAILLLVCVFCITFNALMVYRHSCRQKCRNDASAIQGGERCDPQQEPMISSYYKSRIVAFSLAGLLCELICWCMTVSIYISRFCQDISKPRNTTYGVGFGLSLTGWIAQIIALVLFACAV